MRDTDKPFLMAIEDVFSIAGRGTVACGRVERGLLKKDADVELIGKANEVIKTKVTDIETFKKSCDESRAGDNTALLLRGVRREDVRRGMVVAKPGTATAHTQFLLSMYVLTKDEGGPPHGLPRELPPADVRAHRRRVVRPLLPRRHRERQLQDGHARRQRRDGGHHPHPLAIEAGQRVNLREGGKTVATGLITRVIK